MGVAVPKVAILSAVETVNPNIPSTLDAAALCKMADRGQITGGMLDGPLAFDNAISLQAAKIKHIESAVAGDADIMAVPDLESGNMLAKQLEYLAGAIGSGMVLGARVPIALTSRADGPIEPRGLGPAGLAGGAQCAPRPPHAPKVWNEKEARAMAILAVNAGSSTLKFSLYPLPAGQGAAQRAQRQHRGSGARWLARDGLDVSRAESQQQALALARRAGPLPRRC